MSGVEIAGLVLATFPLIIQGLEHWRDVAKIGGFYWQVRKEYIKCRRNVEYHKLIYKRNMEELLLPIVPDPDEVTRLIRDPGGQEWKNTAIQERLEGRLQESYSLYMEIIEEMNETALELRYKLAPPDTKRSGSPQPSARPSRTASAKSRLEYEMFRAKFSLGESVRNELFGRLKECNERLEKLLSSSDRLSALQIASQGPTKQTSALEAVLRKAWKKADLLFKALQAAWRCSCQVSHCVNLRLEHRTLPDMCFEVILMYIAPSAQGSTPWCWRELQCEPGIGCSFPQRLIQPPDALQPASGTVNANPSLASTPARRREVAFAAPRPTVPEIGFGVPVGPSVTLCKLLEDQDCDKCMGIIGHDDETYHLHPSEKWKRPNDDDVPLTLNRLLSRDLEGQLSRRQRYSIALRLASSVAQLQFTPWLRIGLTKEDVLFFPSEEDDCSLPYGEPFIRQGFTINPTAPPITEVNDCNFFSLGILLLELCFDRRLEDHPLRRKHPVGDEQSKQAFDLMTALKWSSGVEDEGGNDYASAVKWCFIEGSNANRSWRSEIIKNVIRPLELCQEHFKNVAV